MYWVPLVAAISVILAGCSPQMSTCVADDGVDTEYRAKIEVAALAFVRALNAGDGRKAQAMMSAELRPNAGRFLDSLVRRVSASGPMPWKVDGIYYLDRVIGTKAVCIDRTEPNVLNSVAVKPAMRQAHIFIVDGAPLEGMFSLWLIEEGGEWKVHGLSINSSRIAKRDSARLFELAEFQRSRGDRMLAALLFETARMFANRGDYFGSGVRGRIEGRAADFTPPTELTDLTLPWRLGGRDFPVKSFSVTAVGESNLSLDLTLASPEWKGDADAERRGREFVDAFIAAHPAWDQAFDAILVRTDKPGGYHGTVYRKGSGYMSVPPRRG